MLKATEPRVDTTSDARVGYVTNSDRILWRKDSAGNQTTLGYNSFGQPVSETQPNGKIGRRSYTLRGELYRVWGEREYPVEYSYNDFGERTVMKTFRSGTNWSGTTWPASPGTADLTTWVSDPASGVLVSKKDAVNSTTGYTYNERGQIRTRTWARAVTATYSYSPSTAELIGVDYSDATPDLTYGFNRSGQVASVVDASGTRSIEYNIDGSLKKETLPAYFGSRVFNRKIDTTTGAVGRGIGYMLEKGTTVEQHVIYGYSAQGRMDKLSSAIGSAPWSLTNYSFASNSDLVSSVSETSTGFVQNRVYLSDRNLLDVIETKYGSTIKARFDYAYNSIGRRTSLSRTGEVYSRYGAAGLETVWGYNDRDEMTSEVTRLGGTATTLAGRNDSYEFDNLGNRKTVTHNGATSTYTTNSLNQYTQRTVPGTVDVSGLAPAAATITVNGSTAGVTRQGDYFSKTVPVTNSANAVFQSVTVESSYDGSATRSTFVPKSAELFTHDLDGNLTGDGRWTYTYDAENRIVAMETIAGAYNFGAPRQKIDYVYDYQGLRIGKKVSNWSGSSWTPQSDRRFVYQGTNVILELELVSTEQFVASYVWGIDFGGSVHENGGVGGLVRTVLAGGADLLPTFDGNGNVMAYTDRVGGKLRATFEYNSFGELQRQSGDLSNQVKHRFSTKYSDDETGLVYFGYRFYNPSTGRFIGRDPIGEQGGLNLYGFISNRGSNGWDPMGLSFWGSLESAIGSFFSGVYNSVFGGGNSNNGSGEIPDNRIYGEVVNGQVVSILLPSLPPVIGNDQPDPPPPNDAIGDYNQSQLLNNTSNGGQPVNNGQTGGGPSGGGGTGGGGATATSSHSTASTTESDTKATETTEYGEKTDTDPQKTTEEPNPAKQEEAAKPATAPNDPASPGSLSIQPTAAGGSVLGSIASSALDLIGKVWNLPNTALGLVVGGVGYVAGKFMGTNPSVSFGNNAIQFINLPFGASGGGAMTLGNVQLYHNAVPIEQVPRYDRTDIVNLGRHEEAHTYQSQVLGPLFLPVYLATGGISTNNPLETAADNYAAGGRWWPWH